MPRERKLGMTAKTAGPRCMFVCLCFSYPSSSVLLPSTCSCLHLLHRFFLFFPSPTAAFSVSPRIKTTRLVPHQSILQFHLSSCLILKAYMPFIPSPKVLCCPFTKACFWLMRILTRLCARTATWRLNMKHKHASVATSRHRYVRRKGPQTQRTGFSVRFGMMCVSSGLQGVTQTWIFSWTTKKEQPIEGGPSAFHSEE